MENSNQQSNKDSIKNIQIISQPIEEEFNNNFAQSTSQVFYYKVVAKTLGKLLSIYNGQTEYILGKPMFQQAKKNHKGGFYVYATLDEAIFADIPFNKGGLYIAPRTIIKCVCWGEKVEYGNGKISFSNLQPVSDLGMPKGYISTKAGKREAKLKYEQEMNQKKGLKPKIEWKKEINIKKQYQQPMQAYTISIRNDEEYQKTQPKNKLQRPIMFSENFNLDSQQFQNDF